VAQDVLDALGPYDAIVSEHGYGLGPPTGILVLLYAVPHGTVSLGDVHDDFRDQLFWAADGWLVVRRGAELSFAGPHQAVWVRRGTSAEVRGGSGHAVHAVMLREPPAVVAGLSVGLVGLDASARSAVTLLGHGVPEERGLELRAQLLAGLERPEAVAHRARGLGLARQVAAALMADPADPTELREWADRLHVSSRTLQRDFEREYAATWSAWRTRHRLAASLPLLELYPVARVAHLVGYASASAYVAAFRRVYGTTPGRRAAAAARGQN
jgi:AraC-like DNA-binding protein